MTLGALERPVADRTIGWAPLMIVLAGTLVTFLDFFIVNVALPSIDTDLGADPSSLALVVAGYGLTFAVGMITGGRLGDLYGRRRMFVIGLAAFTLTSLACGLAPSVGFLVAARFLQGAAGALLSPQVLAILGTLYSGRRRNTAFAAFGFTMGIAGVLGQLLGGALIQADVLGLGWRSIFLINLPIGLGGALLALRHVPESRGPRASLDLVGTLLVTASVTLLVLPLVEGREHGWPAWTWCCLLASPVLASAFVRQQLRRRRESRGGRGGRAPLIDLALFRERSFSVGSLTAMAFGLVAPSFFFILALYLQQGRGYSALFSGTVFMAVGAGYFAAMLVATAVAERIGVQVLAVGALLVAAGCVLLAETAHASSSPPLLPGLAVVGFGIGLVLVPLSSTVLAGVDPAQAGAASGALATAQQIGAAIGVAVIGTIFFASGPIVHGFVVCLWLLAGIAGLTLALAQFLGPGESGS